MFVSSSIKAFQQQEVDMKREDRNRPDTDREHPFWERKEMVVGVDEAGRGALAGPVVAAAVVLHPDRVLERVRDSKLVREPERERLFHHICESAVEVSIGVVEPDVIDDINILEATMIAMRQAVDGLSVPYVHVFIDGNRYTGGGEFAWTTVVDGDAKVMSIAAASIIAKVTRDRMMAEHGGAFPGYGFEVHKGYGTKRHYEAIMTLGV
ncbi:MAG: ribonuclease HII, partial [Candidatus Kapaibacterium sp.]